ncbi:hypothetical protein PMAYCL1PPCAC_23245, partial [Pristionchus mayeri]
LPFSLFSLGTLSAGALSARISLPRARVFLLRLFSSSFLCRSCRSSACSFSHSLSSRGEGALCPSRSLLRKSSDPSSLAFSLFSLGTLSVGALSATISLSRVKVFILRLFSRSFMRRLSSLRFSDSLLRGLRRFSLFSTGLGGGVYASAAVASDRVSISGPSIVVVLGCCPGAAGGAAAAADEEGDLRSVVPLLDELSIE